MPYIPKNSQKILKKHYNINRKIKNKNTPLVITIAICVIVIAAVMFIYAQLASYDREILAQKNEIEELRKEKNILSGELKGIKSSLQVQEEAMYKLGMVYPEDSQIVYVDTKEDTKDLDINYNVFLSPIVSVLRSFTQD